MKKGTWLVAVLVAGAFALGGCQSGDGVATLGGKDGGGAKKSQGDTARDMAKCLQDAGIKATVTEFDRSGEQAQMQIDTEEMYAMSLGDGGGMWSLSAEMTPAESEAAQKRMEEMVAKYDQSYSSDGSGVIMEGSSGGGVAVEAGEETEETGEETSEETGEEAGEPSEEPAEETSEEPADGTEEEVPEEEFPTSPPYLIVGDQDYTEEFAKCLESSGYTEPEYTMDPADELNQKQIQLEATNKWVKCARENGYPNMKDSPAPVADDNQTQPIALLPADITEPELRTLLENCPNFNPEQQALMDAETEKLNMDQVSIPEMMDAYIKIAKQFPDAIQPNIGFDAPGYNGDWSQPISEDDMTEAERERLNKLQEILWEPMNEYYEAQQEESEDE
ncbi:MAG: hypothetical protein LBL01_05675 [Bifidobacteriaceae bacterium]|jgi:hypothetical protein|nr:hypothetical protein [Bifidobacteriaceae bacterium]